MPAYGDPYRAPLAPRGGLAFAAGALNAVMGIMLALEARQQTGQGQLLDISLQEAVLSVSLELSPALAADNGVTPKRVGKRRPTPPMGQYRTRDGAVVIVAYTPWQWTALAEWIRAETGIEEAASDRYHGTPADRAPYAAQLDQWVELLTSRYSNQEFAEEAQRRGVPVSPVNTLADVLHDPPSRGHRRVGRRNVARRQPGTAARAAAFRGRRAAAGGRDTGDRRAQRGDHRG